MQEEVEPPELTAGKRRIPVDKVKMCIRDRITAQLPERTQDQMQSESHELGQSM